MNMSRVLSVGSLKKLLVAAAFAMAFCAGQVSSAYAADAVDEQEPNDTFETANVISMNQTVYGTTDDYNGGDGNDYFKVVLPVNGDVKITLCNDSRASTSIYLYVYDQNLNRVGDYLKKDARTLGSSSCSIGLKRGVNYIRIDDNDYNVPYHFKLAYVIGGTNVTKVTAAKKAFSLSWVKKSGAASYQIRYTPKSTYKLYDWDKAVKATVSKSSGSAKISGLKAKTAYYVQVRVAKVIDGETYFSSWTSKKTVTTK